MDILNPLDKKRKVVYTLFFLVFLLSELMSIYRFGHVALKTILLLQFALLLIATLINFKSIRIILSAYTLYLIYLDSMNFFLGFPGISHFYVFGTLMAYFEVSMKVIYPVHMILYVFLVIWLVYPSRNHRKLAE